MNQEKERSFDQWLDEHLANETEEYNEEFQKELFKLDLAVQIKKIRIEQNLSQREFAKKSWFISFDYSKY